MPTIAQYLQGFLNSKEAIRSSIINKGVVCNTSVLLSDYASKIDSISSGGSSWTRPSDWLSLPSVVTGDQKIIGLYAVYNTDANFIAFSIQGDYQVDWGDGTTETFTSNSTAQHQYNYSTLSSPVSTRGYKMAIVTITPQSGKNITYANFYKKHSSITGQNAIVSWLDLTVCSSHLGGLSFSYWDGSVSFSYLEQITIIDHNVTNMNNMFNGLYALQSIPLFNTVNVTDISNMFNSCYSIKSVPLFNTANVTTMSSMFNSCFELKDVPLFDTVNVTDMSYMFSDCHALQTVPLFNIMNVVHMSNVFNKCYSLQSVPAFNTTKVTDMSYLFEQCFSLQSVPQFDTANVTNMSNMLEYCKSLLLIPAFNCVSVTNGNFNNFASNTKGVTECLLTNITQSISFQNCCMSASALNTIFGNLVTSSGKTITITGNYGAGACNQSIATGKGWTVTN